MSTRTELVLQKLVNQTASQHAQELHLVAGQAPAMRQDGHLQAIAGSEIISEDLIQDMVVGLLSEEEKQMLESDRSVTTIKEISSLGRFKLTLYYQRDTLALTLKHINTLVPDLASMQLPRSVTDLAGLKRGLVLISGPFDSGKSTLAAALLQHILNMRAVRVMTLEKPLEYVLEAQKGMIEQRSVGRDVISFEMGLELITQEDIDVVFVSEINTAQVAQSVVQLALSDRLVIGVLDNDSAVRSIETLIALTKNNSSFVSDLSDALHAAINLRLLPKQGVPGRIYATEVLLNNPPMRLALRDHDTNRMLNVLQTSRQEGMMTLDQSLLSLVNGGYVSREIVLTVAHDQERLSASLQ